MRPAAPCTPMAFAPNILRAIHPKALRRHRARIESRESQRLRVAGGWPCFDIELGGELFPLIDVSEDGFCLAVADGAIPADRARAVVRRNGEARQSGVARRVWTGARTVGYRFERVADDEAEPWLARRPDAERLRRRLRL